MKTKRFFSSILAVVLAGSICLGVAGCRDNNNPNDDGPVVPQIVVTIDEAPDTLTYGQTCTLSVSISGTSNKNFKWEVSDPEILSVSASGVVTVLKKVNVDTLVTVTAVSNADNTATASKTFTVRPSIDGEIGDLTAEALSAVSGNNITFTGTVTDTYINNENPSASSVTNYDIQVKMNEGAWYGWWQPQGDNTNPVESNFHKGDLVQSSGKYQLVSEYINLQNEVAQQVHTTYDSKPIYWDDNHLWNNLSGLGTDISNKFDQDLSHEGVYRYKPDYSVDVDEEGFSADDYLLTYLAYSLTPVLDETLGEVNLIMEGGEVVGVYGKTIAQVNTDEKDNILQQSYSEFEVRISDIGSTKIPEIKPYEAPDNVNLLQTAIGKMKTAKNYSFNAVMTELYTAQGDPDDYDTSGYSAVSEISPVANIAPIATLNLPAAAEATPIGPFKNRDASSGSGYKVGMTGWVTDHRILFRNVGKYTSYDTNPYYLTFNGYTQYDEGGFNEGPYYEEFTSSPVFRPKVGDETFTGLVAETRVDGNMFEMAMPKWEFSPNLFEYSGNIPTLVGGKLTNYHKFVLRDASITRDVAMQISAHNYASDGAASAYSQLTIYVDDDGNLIGTEFPYDVSGNYIGYITTSFSNFGNVSFRADDFTTDYYMPREVKFTWDKYELRYYYQNHDTSTRNDNYPCDQAFKEIFGDKALNNLFTPQELMKVFGDHLYGPFYDFTTFYKDEDETVVDHYREEISINTEITAIDHPDNVDQNGRMKNVESLLGKNGEVYRMMLGAKGKFEFEPAQSGYRSEGSDSYFAVFSNDDYVVIFESNGTLNIFIEIYKADDYRKVK